MPSIINSDSGAVTGSAGLKFTSADDGVLQIQNNGNTAISISSGGIATFAQPPLTAVPAFRAYNSSTGSLGTTAQVAVPINTIVFDTNNYFDISTYRYTPLIAGYYMFICTTSVTHSSSSFFTMSLYKNGAAADTTFYVSRDITSSSQTGSGSAIVYMNGTTDYVESYARSVGASTGTWNASTFSGFLVRTT